MFKSFYSKDIIYGIYILVQIILPGLSLFFRFFRANKLTRHMMLSVSALFIKYGMTPLMHAAYKGKADMCRLLLQHGADVNCNQHEYGYTALMFASLSGTCV